MSKLLLCTDLDRTLLPNGPEPETVSARERFRQLALREEVTLVYVTGRDQLLVKQAIKNYQLPVPEFVIADVGSSIYKIEKNNWRHLKKWDEDISHDWNGKSNKDLQHILSGFRDIRVQEYSKQKPHKLSYYVPLYTNHNKLLSEIQSCFVNEKVKASLIWSIDSAANIGLLDILPASANKKHAIDFLMKEYNFTLNETVFAGDSGNDISVMTSPIHSVLVANSSEAVKKTALEKVNAHNEINSLYIAKGNYFGMNGNYSAGIIEGVAHYIPDIEKWIGLSNEYEC